MPYISQEARSELAAGRAPRSAGELNYLVTILLKRYLTSQGLSYQSINDIIGVLSAAKSEFYHRIVHDFEQEKCQQNGDVW